MMKSYAEVVHAGPLYWRDLYKALMLSAGPYQKPRSRRRYESSSKSLLPFFGDMLVENIHADMIEAYIRERLNQKRSTATINRDLAVLRHSFRTALKFEWIEKSPMSQVRFLKEPEARVRYLTREEFQRLLQHLPSFLQGITVVAASTGMRLGELTSLTWQQIEWSTRCIRLTDTKNGSSRTVPMNDTAYFTIKSIPRRLGSDLVFTKDGSKLKDFSHKFKDYCLEADIRDFRFHDLRHTSASWMVMQGVEINTVREILGHKSLAMTLRYAHLATEKSLESAKKIDNLFTGNLELFKNNLTS